MEFLKPDSCHEFTWSCFEQFQLFFRAVGAHQSLEIRPWLLLGLSLLFLIDLVDFGPDLLLVFMVFPPLQNVPSEPLRLDYRTLAALPSSGLQRGNRAVSGGWLRVLGGSAAGAPCRGGSEGLWRCDSHQGRPWSFPPPVPWHERRQHPLQRKTG